MLRRQFIQSFITAIASLFLLPSRNACAEQFPLFTCMAAGFQYYQGLALINELAPGDRLMLVREPGNSHDRLAVEIYTPDHRKLGYLPQYLNEIPAIHLDNGKNLYALVHRVDPHLPPWEMLEVAVMLTIK